MNKNSFKLKQILEEISEKDRGLTLFTNPVGSGKSYETSLAIADAIIKNSENKFSRRIYYITPRKKNVEDIYREIQAALKKRGREDLVNKVIKIESFQDSVMNKESILEKSFVADWKESKELIDGIRNFKKLAPELKPYFETQIFRSEKNIEVNFRKKLGSEFRKEHKEYCKTEGKISPYNYMLKSKWSFIRDVYQSIETLNKQVFIMTSKKFFAKNDPIITPSYYFTEGEEIKNSLVIIDEIDAVKKELLEDIVNSVLHDDILDIFGVIYKTFLDTSDMSMWKNTVNRISQIREDAVKLNKKYFKWRREVRLYNLNEEKKLQLEGKYTKIMNYHGVQSIIDIQKNYQYIPYTEKVLGTDLAEEKCNKIVPKEYLEQLKNKDIDSYSISELSNEITEFVDKTFQTFYEFALEYKTNKNNDILIKEREEPEVTIDQAISTVLNKMNLGKNNINNNFAEYVKRISQYRRYEDKKDKNQDDEKEEKDFYNMGLHYTSISRYDEYRDSSVLHNYKIPYTPEIMLKYLALSAHVIGISATAELASINNFNLSYLEKELNSKSNRNYFHEISEENREILEKDYQEKTSGYKDIGTKVIKIRAGEGSKEVGEDLARLYFDREELERKEIKKATNILDETDEYREIQRELQERLDMLRKENPDSAYQYKRLQKVWQVILEVAKLYKKDGVVSNSIITTAKLVRDGKEDTKEIYTLENIKLGALYICTGILGKTVQEAQEMIENMFVILKAGDIKDEKISKKKMTIFEEKFKNKELVFMLTSYSSVSRGNNLQVKIGKEEVEKRLKSKELLAVNNWKNKDSVDWDSIYIEKPTYIIPILRGKGKKENGYKERLKQLIAVEELGARKELLGNEKIEVLKEIFYSFEEKFINSQYYNSLYGTTAVKNDATTTIYQSIGRISRTNVKGKYNCIFYDEDIVYAANIERDDLDIAIVNNEFERFLEIVDEERYESLEKSEDLYEKDYTIKNNMMKESIDTILRRGNTSKDGWTRDLQELWEDIRKLVLKHPVITKKEYQEAKANFDAKHKKIADELGFTINNLYLEFEKPKNKYFYGSWKNREGVSEIYISKEDKKQKSPSSDFRMEVSKEESRLSIFLSDYAVKEHWRKNKFNQGWKITSKEKYHGIISPVVYTNIYKGALGEEVLKVNLKKLGYKCEDIREANLYEKFDFVIRENSKKIYVDAKNFGEASMSKEYANEELYKKIETKIANINLDYALIVNIMDEDGQRKIIETSKWASVPGIYRRKKYNMSEIYTIRNNGEDVLVSIKNIIDKVIKGDRDVK